ncbi:MAG: energy transducer TonB [Chitinophagaceae bacterium]
MTGQQILTADLLDILFENRNKNYGAYELRRSYNYHMVLSILIAFSAVILLLLLLPLKGKGDVLPPQHMPGELTTRYIEIEKQPLVEAPPPVQKKVSKPAPAAAQIQYNAVAIAPDKEVTDVMPTQDEIGSSFISDITTPGAADAGLVPPVVNGNGNAAAAVEEKEKPAVYSYSAPQFPGGKEAWLRFLSRQLRAPSDMAPGEKRSVLIRFLVSANGSITGFEVLQSGGSAFDNEVIRVLKNGPKWKPALENGLPVSRTFTQPVTFVQEEE